MPESKEVVKWPYSLIIALITNVAALAFSYGMINTKLEQLDKMVNEIRCEVKELAKTSIEGTAKAVTREVMDRVVFGIDSRLTSLENELRKQK